MAGCEGQGAAFKARTMVSVDDLELRVRHPRRDQLTGAIRRIVDKDHLEVRVVEVLASLEEAADDALLVVRGDVDGYERLVAESEVLRVALPRPRDPTLAASPAGARPRALPRRRR